MSVARNIVFDFGAVLVHWRPLEVVQQYFPAQTRTPDEASQLARDLFGHADWQDFDAGRASPEQVAQASSMRLSLDVQQLRVMINGIEDHITPIDSSVQVLESLHAQRAEKNLRLFFLSNMPAPYARGLERHAFMRCFDGGIFSGDHGLIKPQPEIYHKLEALYGLRGQPILFIDDHPANIAAAQMQGWQTLHLTEPSELNKRLAQSLIV
jgi:putative hydrolase of the HAD superfamily